MPRSPDLAAPAPQLSSMICVARTGSSSPRTRGEVVADPHLEVAVRERLGHSERRLVQRDGLTAAAELAERRPLVHERLRDDRLEVEPLGDRQGLVGGRDRLDRVTQSHLDPREVGEDPGPRRLVDDRLRFGRCRFEHLERAVDLPGLDEHLSEPPGGGERGDWIAELPIRVDRALRVGLRITRRDAGRLRRPVEERRAIRRIGRDRERLVEIRDGLVVAAERGRAVGRAGEREARLGRDRIGLRTRRPRPRGRRGSGWRARRPARRRRALRSGAPRRGGARVGRGARACRTRPRG